MQRITLGRVVGWMLAYVAAIYLVAYTYETWRIVSSAQPSCPAPVKPRK
jgi:hypothetical protein